MQASWPIDIFYLSWGFWFQLVNYYFITNLYQEEQRLFYNTVLSTLSFWKDDGYKLCFLPVQTLFRPLQCNGFRFLILSKIRELFFTDGIPMSSVSQRSATTTCFCGSLVYTWSPCSAIVNKEYYWCHQRAWKQLSNIWWEQCCGSFSLLYSFCKCSSLSPTLYNWDWVYILSSLVNI